jgi:hypothetical protein
MEVLNTKAFIMSTLECDRVGESEVIWARHIVDSDPPEVGYLLIMETRAGRPTGEKSRLAPIP